VRLRLVAAAAVAAAMVALPASAATAAEAQGCSGAAVSKDAAGNVLGAAEAPGRGATQDSPLPVDLNGSIGWKGSTDAPISNGTWSVTAMGLPILSGTVDNKEGVTSAEGEQSLSSFAPLAWALKGRMLIPVSGQISGTGGTCTASGFITGTGSALGSPLFWLGVVLTVAGLLLVVSVVRGTTAVPAAAPPAPGSGSAEEASP